jgi:hypothetical protein
MRQAIKSEFFLEDFDIPEHETARAILRMQRRSGHGRRD